MARRPEIGNVQLYPNRPLRTDDKNGYVLKFYCPIRQTRVRRNCGTRDRRDARRILRECRERLLNGSYVESGGAIVVTQEQAKVRARIAEVIYGNPEEKSWDECREQYINHHKSRMRPKSLDDASSRVNIAQRILDNNRKEQGLAVNGGISQYATLDALEHLQDRLLAGDESRFDVRSPMTVNTMIGAVMAFIRYCHLHGWIEKVPPLAKLDVDEVMKGRPVTEKEYALMLAAVPKVVGERSADSWKLVLQILWESAFRVADVMDFSWDDQTRIHPVWPQRKGGHPTLLIPSSQKNKKAQEIPMLPGLQELLEKVPKSHRHGWIANPLSISFQMKSKNAWFRPATDDLVDLTRRYNNSAIARACGVSETAVRKWLAEKQIESDRPSKMRHGDIEPEIIANLRRRSERFTSHEARRLDHRPTKEHVSRVISRIGEKARVIVQERNEVTGRRLKYVSAHDLRRGCALRLINAGVSAETLKVVLRHKDFATTERYYGAIRAVQAAASELEKKLAKQDHINDVGPRRPPTLNLTHEELRKLKALLVSI